MAENSSTPTSQTAATVSDSPGGHPFLNKEHRKIRQLFDGIAPRYDFLNHVLSLNLDHRWRRQAIGQLQKKDQGRYLDACCGTGDLTLALCKALRSFKDTEVVGSDFSLPMLQRGHHKGHEKGAPAQWLAGDTLHLPFADESFDGITVGFGIRNVEDLDGGLTELRRVLKPGGRLVLLEFTQAPAVIRPCVDFYCNRLLPRIGNWLSGSPDNAYSYLNQSIGQWPKGPILAGRLEDCGYQEVRWQRLFPGNVALHRGTK